MAATRIKPGDVVFARAFGTGHTFECYAFENMYSADHDHDQVTCYTSESRFLGAFFTDEISLLA